MDAAVQGRRLRRHRLTVAQWEGIGWLLGAMMTAAIWGYTALKIEHSRDVELTLAKEELLASARLATETVERVFSEARNVLVAVDMASAGDLAVAARAVEGLALNGTSTLRRVLLFDGQGRLVTTSNAGQPAISLTDRPYYHLMMAPDGPQEYIGKPIQTKLGGWGITVARRLDSPTRRGVGIVIASVDPNYLASMLSLLRQGHLSLFGVLDRDGTVYARVSEQSRAPDAIGQTLPNLPVLAQARKASQGAYEVRSVLDGVERVVAFGVSTRPELIVYLGRAMSVLLANHAVRSRQDMMAAAAASVLLAALLVALRRVIRLQQGQLGAAETQRRVLEDQAMRDPLTGLLNRRGLALAMSQRGWDHNAIPGPAAVLCIDVDHFKHVNDVQGHAAGDVWLTRVAQQLTELLRDTDLVCRQGGDEFLVVLPGVSAQRLHDIASRIPRCLQTASQSYATPQAPTLSVGSAWRPAGGMLDEMIEAADAALYGAKRSGRARLGHALVQDRVSEQAA